MFFFSIIIILYSLYIPSLLSHVVLELLDPNRLSQAVQESKQLHSISQANDYREKDVFHLPHMIKHFMCYR